MASETDLKNRPSSFLVPIEHISKNDEDRRVVAGYASLDVIDRQGEKITNEAMRKAMEKFMADPEFANTHVMHGNAVVGKVIPSYEDKEGVLWETKVDDTGTFIVSEIRHGLLRADQTWDLIKDGRLRSYSVGGLAISPKEMICQDTGTCHWQINEIEIHEFSYVDRPAVKGADFIIVKRGDSLDLELQNLDTGPKAMTCPIKKVDSVEQTYKQESTKSNTIIMTDTPAEGSKAAADSEQAKSEVPIEVTEVSEEETEKADATPTLLEIKAQNDKILNFLEHITLPSEEPTKVFDYPEAHVKFLQDKYGEESTQNLLTIIGDDYSKLLDKAESTPEEAPAKAEPAADPVPVKEEKVEAAPKVEEVVEDPAPVAEEAKTEPVEEVQDDPPAVDKSQIIEEVQVALTATVNDALKKYEDGLEEYAKVQKRSPVPTEDSTEKISLLDRVRDLSWQGVDELAQRGA